jgi:hypothetical protein
MGDSAKTFRVLPIAGSRSLRWAGALGTVACLLSAATDGQAARVKGLIVGYQSLVNPVWEEGKDAERHLYSFREPVPTVRGEFRRLFPFIPKEICVAALSADKQAAQKPILIRVGGGRTTPVTIVVTPGTQLQFQNTDPFAHRLYAVGVGTFTASDTVKGGVRSWSVPAAGTFEIRDEAAPSLRMWVIGEPNLAAVAYPSIKGEFALSLDAAGDYRVQAYFAGKKAGPEIPVKLGTADVDLGKQPIKVGGAPKADSGDKADKAGKAGKADKADKADTADTADKAE